MLEREPCDEQAHRETDATGEGYSQNLEPGNTARQANQPQRNRQADEREDSDRLAEE